MDKPTKGEAWKRDSARGFCDKHSDQDKMPSTFDDKPEQILPGSSTAASNSGTASARGPPPPTG